MTKAKKAEKKKPYEARPEEIEQRERQRERWKKRPQRPKSVLNQQKDEDGGQLVIEPEEGQDERLYHVSTLEALGTSSIPFLNDTLDNLIRVISPSRALSATQYNAAVAVLAAVEPENELEAMLAAQIVAANSCAMRCMRSMVGADYVDQHKMYGDLANKFLRTVAAQTEALAKLRRGGEQVVKYIHVHEGGQAVVAGTINQQRGAGNVKGEEQPFGADTAEECAPLLGSDETGNGVPIPCDAERKVPTTRGTKSGTAEG